MGLGGVGKLVYLAGLLVLVVFVLRARAGVTNDAAAAWNALAGGAVLVDVRSADEFASGHVEGAINVPHDEVGARLAEFGDNKSRTVVVYCRSGRRAGIAKAELEKSGFLRVINGGGLDQLQAAQPQP